MCSAVKVGPKVSFSKNVMALRFSACRELGIPVDTLKQTALACIAGRIFLPHKEYTSFTFAISAIGVHQFCLSISSISVRFSVGC